MPGEPIYPKHFFESTSLSPRRMCFILMPFRSEFDPVYRAIQRACRNSNYECLRADEIDRPGAILVQIMAHIQEAGVVVADLSGSNANVFYELGIAHVRKENVILLTQTRNDVPFDLRHWRLITYTNTDAGRASLRQRLEHTLAQLQPEAQVTSVSTDIISRALEERGLRDPSDVYFGFNELSRRLRTRHQQCEHGEAPPSFVIYCAVPHAVATEVVDTASREFREWLNPNQRRYEPLAGALFIPYQRTRQRLDGIVATDNGGDDSDSLTKYLLVKRDGYIERSGDVAFCYRGELAFRLTLLVAELWQFVKFASDLCRLAEYAGYFTVFLNMINTRNAQLGSLGRGWLEPFDPGILSEERFRCDQRNIQLSIDSLSAAVGDEAIESHVRRIAERVDNAFGFWEPRAFNHPQAPNPGQLNL